jgi:hypothetical protein
MGRGAGWLGSGGDTVGKCVSKAMKQCAYEAVTQ